MAQEITYTDKQQGQINPVPTEQKFTFNDANEIKNVVNSNASETEQNTLKRTYPLEDEQKLSSIEDNANNYILPTDVVQDANYVRTDENYTTTEKTKLSNIDDNANNYVLPTDVVQDSTYVHTDNNFTDQYESNVDSNNAHRQDTTTNPHGVTASQVGLGNVDNTSDVDKPISTATQTALDDKLDSDINFVDVTASKTLLATDFSTRNVVDSTSNLTITIPAVSGSFAPTVKRTFIQIYQANSGEITINGGIGVTLVNIDNQFKVGGQYGMIELYYVSANTWVVTGRTQE